MRQIQEFVRIPPKWKVMAFAMGLTGELFLRLPGLGILAMFDIFCYGTCLAFLMLNIDKMGKYMRRAILMGFTWTLAAAISCIANGINMHDTLKEIMVVSSSWALLIVAWCVLKHNARLYLFYLVGVGIGAFIGLYYFKQGAFIAMEIKHDGAEFSSIMMDKQKYPIYSGLIVYGCILYMMLRRRLMPSWMILTGFIFAGFFMLMNGGSRSNFGFYVMSALIGGVVVYAPRLAKMAVKNRIQLAVGGAIGIALVFGIYAYLAKSGAMGEEEQKKYKAQFSEAEKGAGGLRGRGSYDQSWQEMLDKPWGNGPYFGKHSVMSAAMACEGVLGLLYWIYFLLQLFWFMGKRLAYCGQFTPFIVLMICNTTWAALGSPFGARHSYFVLLALISLCRDNPNFGAGTLFNLPRRLLPYSPRPMSCPINPYWR